MRGAIAWLVGICLLLTAASGTPLSASEQILLFDSAVEVQPDGALVVEETIVVRAEGRDIRRGIYRDLPIRYSVGSGLVRQVGFTLMDVRRDGRPEPHFTEHIGDHVRIYAGERSVMLQPGEYTYTFRYRTTRQLRYFTDFDEVYWNATGNFWSFPIAKAIVTVTLPEGAGIVQHAAYTGPMGATGRDYSVSELGHGTIQFETTRRLAPGEGLSVAVAFPKGIVPEPGAGVRFMHSVWDNLGLLILALGTLATGIYYYVTWHRVGRDPKKGIIIPIFAPPAGLSPAAVSYVHYQGFIAAGGSALKAFIAALMSLAVKRHIQIDDQGGVVVVEATGGNGSALPGGEAAIMNNLLLGGRFEFTKANGTTVLDAQNRFRKAILREHEGVFFKNNYGYFTVGAVISAAALAAYVLLARPEEFALALLAGLFQMALVGAFVISMGARRILGWVPGGGSALYGVLLTFGGAFILVIAAGYVVALGDELPMLAALMVVAIAFVNVTFYHLLRAPTIVGRQVMDEIEGFRLYLSVAEAEWLNLQKVPEMSAELFEAYLPYAVALGVEKPWSEAFQRHLGRIMPGRDPGSVYHPAWYRGAWSTQSLGRATTGMVSSISTSMAAAMPSSSGSGGGGSSGGGGGGGGGGGW